MALAAGDQAKAREYYEAVLQDHPENLATLMELILLDARENKDDAMMARIDQAMAAHPEALEPRLLLGRYHLNQGRPDKVSLLFDSLPEEQRRNPQVLELLALSQLSAKEPGKAKSTLQQLMKSAPETAKLHLMMARAAAGEGDYKESEKQLRRALEIDDQHLPARIALAKLALTQGQQETFKEQLAVLEVQAPQDPDALLLRAIQASQNGDNKSAVVMAEQAFEAAPGSQTIIALGTYRNMAGDQEGALKVYRQWLAAHPEDIDVMMLIATSLQQGQEAASYFEQVVQLDPENVVALNNLAWHEREQDPAKALSYARRAKKLAPNSADVLDTLAVVEYLNASYEQAQSAIKEALVRRPNDPSILYHSAMISVAMGKTEQARKTLQGLIDEGQDFPEKNEAADLLGTLQQ